MKRDLNALTREPLDLLIIGGGITGACIARDAASRGLSVGLIEKNDFMSATSAAPSKLIHGGLRYLRNFELGLVRESLAERRIWQKIAPHQVRPLPFLLPGDKSAKRVLGIGLTLYDLLSFDRNRLDDPAQHLAGHKWHNADAARKMEPVLEPSQMAGAFTYLDCQVRSPERVGLECLIDAASHGARLANYVEATSFIRDGRDIVGANATDAITGKGLKIRAKITLNAAGPWADNLLGMAEQGEPSHHLLRSKGIHLITRAIADEHAVTISVPENLGGGHLFLLPWRDHTIIGTTDTAYEGNPDALVVTEDEITDYLAFINAAVPGAKLTRGDVVHAYAGLRPLIADAAEPDNPYNASRKAEVVDHEADEGLKGFFSAIGGKWTTSRHVAEVAVNMIGKRLGRTLPKSATASTPLPGGHIERLELFFERTRDQHLELPQATKKELALTYGSAAGPLFELIGADPALGESICEGRDEVAAQIIHGVREEMALSLEDIVFRRTGLGTLGNPGSAALSKAANLMGEELGWGEATVQSELKAVHRLFYADPKQPSDIEQGIAS